MPFLYTPTNQNVIIRVSFQTTKKIVFTKVHVPDQTYDKYKERLNEKMPNKVNSCNCLLTLDIQRFEC